MKFRLLLISLAVSLFCPLAHPDDVSKELKSKLDARYKGHKVKIIPARILVSPYNPGFGKPEDVNFYVHYDHFYAGLEMPTKWAKRDMLDDRTSVATVGTSERSHGLAEMEAGETLEVVNLMVRKRSGNFYAVDLMLKAMSPKRLAVEAGDTAFNKNWDWGVHFRFAFPPNVIESGDYDGVTSEISKYLLPTDEYQQTSQKARNIELEPGMTKAEVLKILGEPEKTVVFGKKATLKYKDMTVELEDDKVVDVKTN